MSDDLGVVNGGEHGAGEEDVDDDDRERRRVPAPRRDQRDDREDGDDDRPARGEETGRGVARIEPDTSAWAGGRS